MISIFLDFRLQLQCLLSKINEATCLINECIFYNSVPDFKFMHWKHLSLLYHAHNCNKWSTLASSVIKFMMDHALPLSGDLVSSLTSVFFTNMQWLLKIFALEDKERSNKGPGCFITVAWYWCLVIQMLNVQPGPICVKTPWLTSRIGGGFGNIFGVVRSFCQLWFKL